MLQQLGIREEQFGRVLSWPNHHPRSGAADDLVNEVVLRLWQASSKAEWNRRNEISSRDAVDWLVTRAWDALPRVPKSPRQLADTGGKREVTNFEEIEDDVSLPKVRGLSSFSCIEKFVIRLAEEGEGRRESGVTDYVWDDIAAQCGLSVEAIQRQGWQEIVEMACSAPEAFEAVGRHVAMDIARVAAAWTRGEVQVTPTQQTMDQKFRAWIERAANCQSADYVAESLQRAATETKSEAMRGQLELIVKGLTTGDPTLEHHKSVVLRLTRIIDFDVQGCFKLLLTEELEESHDQRRGECRMAALDRRRAWFAVVCAAICSDLPSALAFRRICSRLHGQ